MFAIAFILIAILFYIIFTIYALPVMLKPYLERKAGEMIGGEAHIGVIEANPFELALTVRDFSVANNTAKLTWDSLYIDMQLRSIPTQSISLDELRIHSLRFTYTLQQKKEDEFSAAQFFTEAFLARTNMPLNIERFIIQNGALEILDKRTENGRQFSITPISFSLENFSTQYSAGEGNNYNLQFTGLNGGFFHWNGSLQWSPFLSEGEMEIRGLDILQLRDFYQEHLPFVLQNGKLDLRTRYKIVENPEFGFVLENTKLVLNKPSLLADSSKLSMQATSMQVNSLQLSTLNRTLSAGNVILDSVNTHYVLHEIPKPDHRIFEFIAYNADTPDFIDTNANMFSAFLKKSANLHRWQIKIDSILARQAQIKVIDSVLTPATEHGFNNMQLFFTNVTNSVSDNVYVDGSALLNSGELNLNGTVSLFPLRVFGNLEAKNFPLTSLQSYLSRKTKFNLRQGQLATRLNMTWHPDTLIFTGDAEIDTLRILENNQEFIKTQQASVKGLNFMFMPNENLQISNVNFQSPVAYFAWPEKKQKAKPKKKSQGNGFPFIINQINFNRGTLHIADEDPSTPFSYRINAIQGSLRNFSSQKRNADLSMQGKMGGYAPFSLKGFLNLSGRYPKYKFALEAANQDLVVFSPYSGKYAGYRIAKGQVALKMDYDIENNKMQGNNHVVIQDLTFGEAVKSDEATNLPVRLGAALLSDKDGVIDLDVAISGDLDDPEFSVSGLIWKVIKNLLGKAAAAPFRSLMALIGSNSDPEIITFVPGSERPDKAQLDVLKHLSQALVQRPQLHLDIHGNADSTLDGKTIRDAKLLKTLTRNMPASAKWTSASAEKPPLRDTLFAYYQRVEKKNPVSADNPTEEFLVQTARKIWSELQIRQELTSNELQYLANARAQNIKMELLNINASLGERVFVVNDGNLSKHTADLKVRERY
ncbi:MAG: DUF748 domain-containing protein, partial [Fibromonadaceae bacterium]|nr:DUF748 domain-containing protein [Fibromonadaceae bacterium]